MLAYFAQNVKCMVAIGGKRGSLDQKPIGSPSSRFDELPGSLGPVHWDWRGPTSARLNGAVSAPDPEPYSSAPTSRLS